MKIHAPTLKVLVYDGWSKLRSERKAASKVTSKKSVASKRKGTNSRGHKGKRRAETDDDEMDIDEDTRNDNRCGDEGLVWEEYINTFDVCVTTYNVLRQDLTVARAVPVRPRREDVVYSNATKPRSPLVVCDWYRVIMDEVSVTFKLFLTTFQTIRQVQMAGGGKVELRI
jgi:E3 ubiquitin-protein ligase SHPRH